MSKRKRKQINIEEKWNGKIISRIESGIPNKDFGVEYGVVEIVECDDFNNLERDRKFSFFFKHFLKMKRAARGLAKVV